MNTLYTIEFLLKFIVIIIILISTLKVMRKKFLVYFEEKYNKNPKNVTELVFLFLIIYSSYVITQIDLSTIGFIIKIFYLFLICWLCYLLKYNSFIKNLPNNSEIKNKIYTLNKAQKKELFFLFKKWFKNNDSDINNLIELNIENLKNSKLICESNVVDFYLIIIFLINENIYNKEDVKKFINNVKIEPYRGKGEFNFGNYTKYKSKFNKEWDENENNFKPLNKYRNKNRALIRNYINHFYSTQSSVLLTS